MKCINFKYDINNKAYMIVKNEIVIEVSQAIADMTEYDVSELLYRNIVDVFKILRIGPDLDYNSISETNDCFMFTKKFDVRFVNIKVLKDIEKCIYSFDEKIHSRIEEKFSYIEQLMTEDSQGIAVYSAPDMTLLKASKTYLDFFDAPNNIMQNTYGRTLRDFTINDKYVEIDEIIRNTISSQKSQCLKEIKFNRRLMEEKYYNKIITPLKENGVVKYIIISVQEVTERVLYSEKNYSPIEAGQFISILESIDDAIFVCDSNKNFIYLNKAAKGYFPGNELIQYSDSYNNYEYYDLCGNKILFENMPLFRLLKGEIVLNQKMTFINGKKTMHICVSGNTIYDTNGSIRFAVICIRDITRDFEIQKEMNKQNELIKAIINNISDNIMVFDKEGSYIIKNRASKCNTSTTEYYKVGDSYTRVKYFDLNGDELPFNDIPAVRILNGEKLKEQIFLVKYKDEEIYIDVSGTPTYDENGEFIMGVICTRNITELMVKNQIIREQKEELETIIDNMYDSVVVVDKDGKIVRINTEGQRLFQTVDTATSFDNTMKITTYFDSNKSSLSYEFMPSSRAARGEKVRNERVIIKRPEKEIVMDVNAAPVYDKNGNIIMIVSSGRDMTEHVRKENELKENQLKLLQAEKEKNEALSRAIEIKDEFLSMISHDLRTPLNVISTAMQAINYFCNNEMSDKAKKYMNMIKQNVNRQLRLVNNLLDITRANAGRISVNKKNIDIVFITKAITESCYEYASQKGINMTFEASFDEKIIALDDDKYERVLLNLLSNAIKFTPSGKCIKVKLYSYKKNICIKVIDSGIGIPKEYIDKIFERFGQVSSSLSKQAEGSGIGLSLVKKFVEVLGGSVSVKSTVGKGSTFTVLLPNDKIPNDQSESKVPNLIGNRLIEVTNVEFSEIYF